MSARQLANAQNVRPSLNSREIGLMTRLLHWTIAALLVSSFAAAWAFNFLEPGPVAAFLVLFHQSIGLVLLVLMLVRFAWRVTHPLPSLPGSVPHWEKLAAFTVQAALYAALLAMPLIGWLGSNAQGDTVDIFGLWTLPDLVDANKNLADELFSVHGMLSWVVIIMIAMHIAGALRHHFIKRDAVLVAMLKGQ